MGLLFQWLLWCTHYYDNIIISNGNNKPPGRCEPLGYNNHDDHQHDEFHGDNFTHVIIDRQMYNDAQMVNYDGKTTLTTTFLSHDITHSPQLSTTVDYYDTEHNTLLHPIPFLILLPF